MLRDVADNGVAAVGDRHVLHGDGGLAMAAMAVERVDLGGEGAGEPAQGARGAVVLGDVARPRQVLGTCVIGGMMAASLLAIFFIPVSFEVVEKFGTWLSKEKPPHAPPKPGMAEGAGDD